MKTREATSSQQLVIWTSRIWVGAFNRRQPVLTQLENTYRGAGCPEAAHDIDELFGLIVTGARRRLNFGCLPCRHIHSDEALVINVIAAFQNRMDGCGECILDYWMHPEEARMAGSPARAWANALAANHWIVPTIRLDQLQPVPQQQCDEQHQQAAVR